MEVTQEDCTAANEIRAAIGKGKVWGPKYAGDVVMRLFQDFPHELRDKPEALVARLSLLARLIETIKRKEVIDLARGKEWAKRRVDQLIAALTEFRKQID